MLQNMESYEYNLIVIQIRTIYRLNNIIQLCFGFC